ncbi:MAG TPA: PIN domain-containing protein [Anaerolineales bacterium]|nr:PIN domain-containing protein [Anaerolineales bacterium]
MSAEFFLDTHVIVYSFDAEAPYKSTIAFQLIRDALQSGAGVISTQVVQEFLNVAEQKFRTPMKAEDAREFLVKVLNPLCKVYPDLSLYETALEIQDETGYSFYDALILAGAIQGGCAVLYSEDLQAGRVVRGVRIENPFAS